MTPFGYIGIDPDLTNTAVAYLVGDKITKVDIIKAKGKKKESQVLEMMRALCAHIRHTGFTPLIENWVLAVEAQVIAAYHTKNPMSILHLGQVAAAALTVYHRTYVEDSPNGLSLFPRPTEWKGSVPKEIHQARICKKLKWKYTKRSGYCVPEGIGVPELARSSDWKHGLDAVGLALWAREQHGKTRIRT